MIININHSCNYNPPPPPPQKKKGWGDCWIQCVLEGQVVSIWYHNAIVPIMGCGPVITVKLVAITEHADYLGFGTNF